MRQLYMPVYGIGRCCEVLFSERDGRLNEKQLNKLEVIYDQTDRLLDLIYQYETSQDTANLAHSTRTPLSVIVTSTYLLRQHQRQMGALTPKQIDRLRLIERYARSLNARLNHLLQTASGVSA